MEIGYATTNFNNVQKIGQHRLAHHIRNLAKCDHGHVLDLSSSLHYDQSNYLHVCFSPQIE
jgi:hypothetical protein